VLNWLDALLIHQQHLAAMPAGMQGAAAASPPAADGVAAAVLPETGHASGRGSPASAGYDLHLIAAALALQQRKAPRHTAFDQVFAADLDDPAARSVDCAGTGDAF